MTYTGAVPSLQPKANLIAPREIDPANVSIVVAVHNDLDGIRRVLASVNQLQQRVREVVVVDDGSAIPLSADLMANSWDTPTHIIRTSGLGAGAARNMGVNTATGNWLWFVDSDCHLMPDALHNFQQASDGAIAYAGGVNAGGKSLLSSYYDLQRTLVPPATTDDGTVGYIVTANALVWRDALVLVGGFDSRFYMSAGEDVDLGLRLGQVGRIKCVSNAAVAHDYGGYVRFVRRFCRYGRANAVLCDKYDSRFSPRWPSTKSSNPLIHMLAGLQYGATQFGYLAERLTWWNF